MTAPAQPAPSPPRRRGYWIPGLVATAVVLAIGVAFGAGDLDHRGGPSTLAGTQIAQDLAQSIQARDGSHSPPELRCPDSEPVRAGVRFVCSITDNGPNRPVDVVEINGRGALSWTLGR